MNKKPQKKEKPKKESKEDKKLKKDQQRNSKKDQQRNPKEESKHSIHDSMAKFSESLLSFEPCFHRPENSGFYVQEGLPPFQKSKYKTHANQKLPIEVKQCEICAAYGLQSMWQAVWRPIMGITSVGNENAVSPEEMERGQAHSLPKFEWRELEGSKDAHELFNFALDANQFGETFHLLISAILSPSQIRIGLKDASDQQKQLLRYYFNSETAADVLTLDPALNFASKASATGTISYFFEKYHKQEEVFDYIRSFMDMRRFANAGPNNKYACPSYCGKYWINRYLRATQGMKLPKSAQVDRIAVINVRRAPETMSKDAKALQTRMEMTKSNLHDTILGIIAANRVAQLDESSPNLFSHVILYGDLTPEDATSMTRLTRTWLEKLKQPGMAIEILYITSPWRVLEPSAEGNLNENINKIWANFRGDKGSFLGGKEGGDVDCIPYQVKIVGIYLALQARYGNKLCYIGARSGFLETAAFLGSPIFYYNETNSIDNPKQKYDDGTVLWDGPLTRKLYGNDRMGRAVNALNTLICVDLVNVVRSTKTAKQVFVGEQGKKQLAAALYMFMLARTPSGVPGPMWEHRVAMRFGDDQERAFLKAKWDRCATLWTSGQQGDKLDVSKGVQDLLSPKAKL